jgi:hypothetical protein
MIANYRPRCLQECEAQITFRGVLQPLQEGYNEQQTDQEPWHDKVKEDTAELWLDGQAHKEGGEQERAPGFAAERQRQRCQTHHVEQ